jgi:hypothetical protein
MIVKLLEGEKLECTDCHPNLIGYGFMLSFVNHLSVCPIHGKTWHRILVKKENTWEIKNPVPKTNHGIA